MKNAKRILEKFDSWKYDIYESNKSDWTKQDDKDVNEIEKLLEQQLSNFSNILFAFFILSLLLFFAITFYFLDYCICSV